MHFWDDHKLGWWVHGLRFAEPVQSWCVRRSAGVQTVAACERAAGRHRQQQQQQQGSTGSSMHSTPLCAGGGARLLPQLGVHWSAADS